jgi:hypothetical protein
MDLTAAIHLKIEHLRNAKTTRYNTLASALERELALLTHRSAELFTKLEDALEAKVLEKSDELEDTKGIKEEEIEMDVEDGEEDPKMVTSESTRDKQSDTMQEPYDVDEDQEYDQDVAAKYYNRPTESRDYYDPVTSMQTSTSLYPSNRPPSRSSSLSSKLPPKRGDSITNAAIPTTSDIVPLSKIAESKPPEYLVSYLRSQAQETQNLLTKKHVALTQLRQKHDAAMKRLDKLQSDLGKVSQKWESEERARIQSESSTALGKRKREEDGSDDMQKKWKNWGKKGVEWGVLFGFGVASAVGLSKFATQ